MSAGPGTGGTGGAGGTGPEPRRILVGGFVVRGGGGAQWGGWGRGREHRTVLRERSGPGRSSGPSPGSRRLPALRPGGSGHRANWAAPSATCCRRSAPGQVRGARRARSPEPGSLPPCRPPRPFGSRCDFRSFPRRRGGRGPRGRVPWLSRRGRDGRWAPLVSPDAGTGRGPGAGVEPGSTAEPRSLGFPSVERQVVASGRGGVLRAGVTPPVFRRAPGSAAPRQGHGEGFREPGMRRQRCRGSTPLFSVLGAAICQ